MSWRLGPARRRDRRLLAAGRELTTAGLAIGSLGNVSVRVADGMRITPTRIPYDTMSASDLVTVDVHGRRLAGRRIPSREAPLHAGIYRARPDVHAVVHTHSPHAIAWSFLGEPLQPHLEEADYYGIGAIQVSCPARAGSERLAANAVAALGGQAAALLGQHGVVAVGASLDEAVTVARVVEHHASVAWLLRLGSSRAAMRGAA